MKVISGFLKGRIINGYKTEGTRPTMDSVKESLFAMIQSDIKDSICLDLFAGSGSLGIEAISNGAKFVYFVDHNKKILNILKKNIVNFKIETFSKVILADYKKALLKFNTSNIKFNLVFLDPPYQVHVIEDILKFLNEKDMIVQQDKLYVNLIMKHYKIVMVL